MSQTSPQRNGSREPKSIFQRFVRAFVSSRLLGTLANFPPIASLTKRLSRPFIQRQLNAASPRAGEAVRAHGIERSPTEDRTTPAGIPAAGVDEVSAATLHSIVTRVVDSLGYIGAMIATYEQGDVLPVRAFYVDPSIADEGQLRAWESEISRLTATPISITDPAVARVYRYDDTHRSNLSIVAVENGGPVRSKSLYDLFTPIAPLAAKPIVETIQEVLGIVEVIAVPFFNYVHNNGHLEAELVGNLFAAKRDAITSADTLVLGALGQQAASLLESERRQSQSKIVQEIIYQMQVSLQDERVLLQKIADGIVRDLGYAIAVVGTTEPGNALALRAIEIDPSVATAKRLNEWEAELSKYTQRPVRLRDESLVRVYTNHDAYRDNIIVRAIEAGAPVISEDLYDWMRPVIPKAGRSVSEAIQAELSIQRLIAMPIYAHHLDNTRELVGALVVSTRSRTFTQGEIEMLSLFGEQAAVGIRNARLYRTAEERRLIAQTFAKMAFTSAAATHYLSGHLSFAYGNLSLMKSASQLPEGQREEVLSRAMANLPRITERLHSAIETLRQLDSPFKLIREDAADINWCIRVALDKGPGGLDFDTLQTVLTTHYTEDLPQIRLSSDMLIAAFGALIENGVDALKSRDQADWEMGITTQITDDGKHVQITVRDNGDGIPPENVGRIFEMGWTTKRGRLGFGLFWTKDFIEGLGGSIEVESRRGIGTTFAVKLPVTPQTQPVSGVSDAPGNAGLEPEEAETQPSRQDVLNGRQLHTGG